MGLTYTILLLSNPRKTALKPIEAKVLVDSGAAMLCILLVVQFHFHVISAG